MKVELREQDAKKQCPYCRGALGDDATHACSGCATEYHADCAREAGRCGILGCGVAFSVAPACPRCRRGVAAHEERWRCHVCAAGYHGGCGTSVQQCAVQGCPGIILPAASVPGSRPAASASPLAPPRPRGRVVAEHPDCPRCGGPTPPPGHGLQCGFCGAQHHLACGPVGARCGLIDCEGTLVPVPGTSFGGAVVGSWFAQFRVFLGAAPLFGAFVLALAALLLKVVPGGGLAPADVVPVLVVLSAVGFGWTIVVGVGRR